MARTRDLGRSRQIIAERKQREAAAKWDPGQQPDRSWMKWARCKICGVKRCINNNDEREDRPYRYMGVFNCRSIACKKAIPLYLIVNKQAQKGNKKALKALKALKEPPYPGEL